MKRTKSLSFKLTAVTTLSVFVAIAIGVGAAYLVQANLVNRFIDADLSNSTLKLANDVNDSLLRVEATVEQIHLIASKELDETSDLEDEQLIGQALTTLQKSYELTAQSTKHACAYWFILNPEYTHTTRLDPEGDGFFYVKVGDTFVPHAVTNVLKYPERDVEHVGWWTAVKSSRQPTWMDPYYNANVDLNMFSYIEPFYANDGSFLGAIGIDLGLESIIASIQNPTQYNDSYAALLKNDGKIIYHPDVLTINEYDDYVGTTVKFTDLTGGVDFPEGGTGAVTYKYNGRRRTASGVTLRNSMKYVISVSTGELRQPLRLMILVPLSVYLLLVIGLTIVVHLTVKKALKPLFDLNNAMAKVEEGDLDVQIKAVSDDEVGQLTTSFDNMIHTIKSKNNVISAMAYNDGLTGVKNRNAKDAAEERINKQIEEGTAEFAIVMLDVNGLKEINDIQGHVAGDTAIRNACFKLCDAFSHSPIFRIGGDEFMAILESRDYHNRDALLQNLIEQGKHPDSDIYDYSVGMSAFDKDEDKSFADVFKKADEYMYEMKKRTKKYVRH